MNLSQFQESLQQLGIILTPLQMEQLEQYYELLIDWNTRMNLTGITEKEQVYLKHFYDSATLIKVINKKDNISLCDLGSGAGFPGLVLKILFPNMHITLVDSLQKRIHFLNTVIEKLQLKDIETKAIRAEDYAKTNREKFDIVTARAVAHLSILLEYALPLVKVNGIFVAMKADIKDEIKSSLSAMKILHCQLIKEETFLLPIEESKRTLVVIKKESPTPLKYPRKYSDIKNHSL